VRKLTNPFCITCQSRRVLEVKEQEQPLAEQQEEEQPVFLSSLDNVYSFPFYFVKGRRGEEWGWDGETWRPLHWCLQPLPPRLDAICSPQRLQQTARDQKNSSAAGADIRRL